MDDGGERISSLMCELKSSRSSSVGREGTSEEGIVEAVVGRCDARDVDLNEKGGGTYVSAGVRDREEGAEESTAL